ncbi:hypothetical protein RQP46_009032 [Phenoliferia psychrophenolica]
MATPAMVSAIQSLLPPALQHPKLGIVCGSGLGGLGEILADKVVVPYSSIPGFAQSTVAGHKSALAFGLLGERRVPVVCQLGRFHAYEGHPMSLVILPMRLMKALGISHVILTNAAGGLEPNNDVGTVVVLRDHVGLGSMTSWNPLIGENDESLGPRFPPMSDAYDFDFRMHAFRAARALSWPKGTITEGIYAWVAGPTYETRAEQRFLRAAGADVVGMSTVPEVIAARHAGIKVLVLSLVTNIVVATPYRSAEAEVDAELSGVGLKKEVEVGKDEEEVASHQEVLDTSAKRADDIRALVERIADSVFAP